MAEEQAQGKGDVQSVAEGAEAQKPSRKKLFIIIGAAIGVLLLLGLILWLFMAPKSSEESVESGGAESKSTEEQSESTLEAPTEIPAPAPAIETDPNIDFGETHTFKPFQLNLGNPLENHYVRIEVSIEYRGGENHLKEITRREPQLRDVVVSIVGKKSREFLLSPDGKDQLRRELLIQMNRYMKTPIEAVFITDFLVE